MISLPPLPEWAKGSCWERDINALLLQAQRMALEEAAKEAEHWQKISTTPGHACGQYIAQVIRRLTNELEANHD